MSPEIPPKRVDVQAEVRRLVKAGWVVPVQHALLRMQQRSIQRQEVEFVLAHGKRVETRDSYDEERLTWRYVIEGKTPNSERRLRVAFCLGEAPPLPNIAVIVITVVDLNG